MPSMAKFLQRLRLGERGPAAQKLALEAPTDETHATLSSYKCYKFCNMPSPNFRFVLSVKDAFKF